MNGSHKWFDKIFVVSFAIIFCGVLAYAGLRERPITDPGQFFFLRLIAAASAACVGVSIPGLLTVNIKLGKSVAIRTVGAIGLFVIVYLVNPPKLIAAKPIINSSDRDVMLQQLVVKDLLNKNNRKAEVDASDALKTHPDSARLHYNLAVAIMRNGDQIDDAEANLEMALNSGILSVLKLDESISDPIGYVLNDPDLKMLFAARPGLRIVVTGHANDLKERMGTSIYGYGGCFGADTAIRLINGSTVPIGSIRRGDSVASINACGDNCVALVKSVISSRHPTLILNGKVVVTTDQPVFVRRHGWCYVRNLVLGDQVYSQEGFVPVCSIDPGQETFVFDLTVSPGHTFFADGLLSHNKCGVDFSLLEQRH